MAEVLVTGKKISEMGLVSEITGEEKIPTSALGDKAVTTGQLLTYLNNNNVAQWGRIGGDITNQVDLQNQFTQERHTLKSYTQEQVSQQQAALQEYIDTTNEVFDYTRENGSALPYREGISYEEDAVVIKDGVLQQWKGGEWRPAVAESLLDTIQTFNTPEAGVDPVTGVADGAYFNVRSESDGTLLDEYQNVGGVPTLTGKSYPSAAYVHNLSERVDEVTTYTAMPFVPDRTYLLNERVQLASGDIVKSTVANNTVDPNLDMTGWVNTSHASQIIDLSGLNQQQVNDLKVDKVDVLPATQTKDSFKNAYSSKKGNQFRALRDSTPCGRAYIWKNPQYSTDETYRFSLGINQSGWNTAEWDFVADVDDFYRMRYGFTNAIREPSVTAEATDLSVTPFGIASNNHYFRSPDQLNANFKITFSGTGFLMNHRCDEDGGLWSISVDGGAPFIVSTHINNPENVAVSSGNITKLITDSLSNGTHTAVFTFIGDDPLYPPTDGVSRGWFKKKVGSEVEIDAAYVITGNEMGRKATGPILVSNAILEFAISAKPSGSGFTEDWVPAHGSASGCIVVNSRKIFIDNEILSDTLTTISTERELKEFTMIQDYTAYNSNDTARTLPMWNGRLITKFNSTDGLTYNHSFITVNDIDVRDGYTAMCSGQRRDSSGNILFTKIICDNGYEVDISALPPASQISHNSGVLKSAQWIGAKHGLAINVESVESSSALGRPTTDENATLLTERPDRFCKLYFKPLGKNKTIPSGTEFSSRHSIFLAML